VRRPMRTCIGCRKVAAMTDLVRITRVADGSLLLGRNGAGRGAWLCEGSSPGWPEATCVEQAVRRKALTKALRAPIEVAAMEALRERVEERARIESGGTESVAARRRD
jgi:predicted RNA-binding protein YlxR (DUF448 family)